MKIKNYIIPFILLILSTFNSFTQKFNPYFNSITKEQGISSNRIRCIFQDKVGFMWFGTEDGLNRFDGISFVSYKNNSSDSLSLSCNYVTSIVEELATDNLIIGTNNKGISYFNRDKNSFTKYKNIRIEDDIAVTNLTFDVDTNLWISTEKGLYIYINKTKTLQKIPFKKLPNELYNIVFHVLIEKQNAIISTEGGLFIYNLKNDELKPLFEKENITSTRMVTKDYSNNYWISSLFGIYKVIIFPEPSIIQVFSKENYPFSFYDIRSILEDKEKNLFIAAYNIGLYYYNHLTQKFSLYLPNKLANNSLSSNGITTQYISNTGIIWIGTNNNGINFIDNQKKKFTIIKETYKSGRNINNYISYLFKDSENKIWVGIKEEGGLSQFHRETETFTHYPYKANNPNSISSDFISCINELDINSLIVGTIKGGIYIFNKKTKSFSKNINQIGENNSLINNNIFYLYKDIESNIWAATEGGLIKFQLGINKFTTINNYSSRIIIPKDKNHIWIGTRSNGLIMINTNTLKKGKFKNNQSDSKSISNNTINALTYDKNHQLWIGTNDGLNRYVPETNSFIHYNKENGMSSSSISAILVDEQNNLWISTTNGISKFNQTTKAFKNYYVNDGLQGNDFEISVALKTNDGEMFFGGSNGLNAFYPEQIIDNKNIPNIVVTDFKLFNKSVSIGGYSPLKKHITRTSEIILNYDQSNFSLDFVALNFTSPEKNKYAYMLEGFDEEWINNEHNRTASYTNMSPGQYIFKVKGSNNDGYWNENGTKIKISILLPWWKTWWFRIISILIIIGVFYSLLKYRINFYSRKQNELESLVKIRTQDLERSNEQLNEQQKQLEKVLEELKISNEFLIENQKKLEDQSLLFKETNNQLRVLNSTKDRFFTIIAHDLRNPIGVLNGFSELLIKNYKTYNEEKLEKFFLNIYNTSKSASTLLENLLQWAQSQSDQIIYTPSNIKINITVNEVVNLLIANAKAKNITINQEIDTNIFLYADENMINTIIRNLISNAIKYTPQNGTITVSAKIIEGYVEISIADNGVGISIVNQKTLFNLDTNISTKGTANEKGTGLGLILCKDFVLKHNGKIWVESEEGKGSKFKFTIPLATGGK